MPRYRYQAFELGGAVQAGELDSPSLAAARSDLEARGWTVTSLELSTADGVVLSDDDFLEAGNAAAELSSGGLPLEAALLTLVNDLGDRKAATALREMGTRLERGESWQAVSASLGGRHPAPPLVATIVQTRLPPLELGRLLERAIEATRRGRELRRKTWMSLLYSGVLLICLVATILAFLFWFVPILSNLLLGFGTQVPEQTQLIINASDSLTSSRWSLVLWTAVGIFACVVTWRWIGDVNRARLLRAIPIFGAAQRNASLATFCRLLGVSVEYRLPLTAALQIAGTGCEDAELADGCRRMVDEVQAGGSLAAAIRPRVEFPDTLGAICRQAEHPAVFADSLQSLGDLFESSCRNRTRIIAVVVEPVMFVVIATSLIFLVSTVSLPLIRLLNDLS